MIKQTTLKIYALHCDGVDSNCEHPYSVDNVDTRYLSKNKDILLRRSRKEDWKEIGNQHFCPNCFPTVKDVRVISLWQPWATLFAYGIKKLETRPRATSHRGIYLIHASKNKSSKAVAFSDAHPYRNELIDLGYNRFEELPFGYIIGACVITDCYKMGDEPAINGTPINPKEQSLGDYSPGRWAWECTAHQGICRPRYIPYTGSQGYYGKFKHDGLDENELVNTLIRDTVDKYSRIITTK